MPRYLPPFQVVQGLLNVTSSRGKTRVDMTFDEVKDLIRHLLSVVEVDEAFYLARNPDVAEGIAQGNIKSAREHFLDHGYFEGRMPYPILIDEQWYLDENPDIVETVQKGEYESAQAHFDGPGYREGRRPSLVRA